jgi:16S rRNA (guanine527-N7)-methyltransferase
MMKLDQVLNDHLKRFEILYELYSEYNSHTNISAIREKNDVFEKHFKDSIQILCHHDFSNNVRVLDLGSGGGFPILPLAIVLPDVQFFALDATAKKTKFIELVKEKLNLENLEILTGRAEDFAHNDLYRESFDFVLARAVAKLNVLLELCSGFIKEKGFLFAYKAYPLKDEELESISAQKKLSLQLKKKKRVSEDKQILFFSKLDKLGNRYPRQFAQIKSKPL